MIVEKYFQSIKKNFNAIYLLLVVLSVFSLSIKSVVVSPSVANAASVGFQPQNLSLPQEKAFTVTITIDTEGANLNAIDGTIVIAPELGNAIVTDSGSVITYWVTRPQFDETTRSINFSGTIPGGYTGKNGILMSLVMPAYSGNKLANAISITNLKGYLNDGFGTPAKISIKQFVLGSGSSPVDPEIKEQLYIDTSKPDNIPPETFSPQVTRDDRVFDGQWFINFATTDKQSGIDRYEIQESLGGRIEEGRWKVASSPYVLEDQALHSYIYITAIDRQGNERIIKVFPKYPQSWWFRYGNSLLWLLGILFILGVSYILNKRRMTENNLEETNL